MSHVVGSACAEHGAPVGRSPPRSTTRKRKVRREGERKRSRLGEFFGSSLRARPFFFSLTGRATTSIRSLTLCEKKNAQFAASASSDVLTDSSSPPSVSHAPSTEHPRLMVL